MKLNTLFIAIVMGFFSGSLMAGKILDINVVIDKTERTASGNMKTARFSANAEELIGCGSRSSVLSDGSVRSLGWCQAGLDTDENYVFCWTDNPELITQINASSAFSYLSFRWNEDGICDYIGHSTQSVYIPSKKDK